METPAWRATSRMVALTKSGCIVPGQDRRGSPAYPLARVKRTARKANANAVRALTDSGADVGIVINLEPKHAASDKPEDLAAANRADAYFNRQYLDPVMRGTYPTELADIYGEGWPGYTNTDAALTKEPLDFIGINYYSRSVVRNDPDHYPDGAPRVRQDRHTHTTLDWEVFPDGLREALTWVAERYGPIPLYVTENGAAFYDPPQVPESGIVSDPLRVDYFRRHIGAVEQAIAEGADVRGYFAWSLMDNFEWAAGYGPRFGLVHVDYETQMRTPKDSARYYGEVIQTNGASIRERAH